MRFTQIFYVICLLSIPACMSQSSAENFEEKRPHIIFILADDLVSTIAIFLKFYK